MKCVKQIPSSNVSDFDKVHERSNRDFHLFMCKSVAIVYEYNQYLQFRFIWVSDGNSYIYNFTGSSFHTHKSIALKYNLNGDTHTHKHLIAWFVKRYTSSEHIHYLLDILGLLCPWAVFPFCFDVSRTPGLTHNTGWCMVWEFDGEFRQLHIIQAVCLTWDICFWSIDEHLKITREKKMIFVIRNWSIKNRSIFFPRIEKFRRKFHRKFQKKIKKTCFQQIVGFIWVSAGNSYSFYLIGSS